MLTLSVIFLFLSAYSQPAIGVELVASGFNEPVDIACAGDERLFIVERQGIIKILNPDNTVSTFLNIDALVGSAGGEQGLLGLVFHPDYASNGNFYVNYTDNLGDTHISRFTVSVDPDVANAGSEMNLLFMDQPAANHNGGCLKFGPDGFLYIFMGDGGGAGHNRSQDITDNLLGKILRLDVDGGIPYAIPPGNPFVGIEGDDEIWVTGLRNPWRNNFDRLTGDLWIADVGADSWEEIDFIHADTMEIWNFGWKCYEGNMLREGDACDTVVFDFDFPIFEYPHNIETGGFAVTGGYVYRGSEFPSLYGKYIFCDYISGNFWTTEQDGLGDFITIFHDYIIDHITSFGEDMHGELYACINETGDIYKIVDPCANFNLSFNITDASASTINNGAINLNIAGGNSPFTYIWSNGAITEDINSLSAGTYSVTVTNNIGCIKTGVVTITNLCGQASGVTNSPTATSVFINWNEVGATGYRVLYKPVGPGTFTTMNTAVSQINISGLEPSTAYTFKIKNKCPGAPGSFTTNGNFTTDPLKLFGVEEINISIYPNPNNGIFNVEGISEATTILIYDFSGKLISSFSEEDNFQFNMGNSPNGIYVVKFLMENGLVLNKKLIIQY